MKLKIRPKALDEIINRCHHRCTTIVLHYTMPCTYIYICILYTLSSTRHNLYSIYIDGGGSIEDVFVISDRHNAFPAYTVHLIKTLSEEYPVTWRYQHKITGVIAPRVSPCHWRHCTRWSGRFHDKSNPFATIPPWFNRVNSYQVRKPSAKISTALLFILRCCSACRAKLWLIW